jgi:hypothetical protein
MNLSSRLLSGVVTFVTVVDAGSFRGLLGMTPSGVSCGVSRFEEQNQEYYPLHAYLPSRRRPPAKVRLFLSFIELLIGPDGFDHQTWAPRQYLISRGDPAEGIPVLRSALGLMQAEQYHVLTIALHRALAEGLIQIGQIDETAIVIGAALVRSEAHDEFSNVSELLRVRGEVWLRTTPADSGAAENALQRSRAQPKSQSALSLELRSTMALAQLWSSQGKATDAAELLEGIYRRFSEGHDRVDLRHAGHLLATLDRAVRLTPFNTG